VGNDWTVEGVADLNGDGRADIVWRHTSGAAFVWLMNGTALLGSGSLGTIGTEWTIAGIGG
jgi:hypothetical protein